MAVIVDSQSVKTTQAGRPRGFHAAKHSVIYGIAVLHRITHCGGATYPPLVDRNKVKRRRKPVSQVSP